MPWPCFAAIARSFLTSKLNQGPGKPGPQSKSNMKYGIKRVISIPVEQRGIIDETGCRRYTMTLEQLQALYKQFENFVADCPQQEYNENKSAIIAMFSLIHKHINAEIYK